MKWSLFIGVGILSYLAITCFLLSRINLSDRSQAPANRIDEGHQTKADIVAE